MRLRELVFQLPRAAPLLYSLLCLVLSSALLLLSLRRGPREFALWLVAYLGVGALSLRLPSSAPLMGGAAALLLGFVKTYRGGVNLDLGLSLIALTTGLYLLGRTRRTEGGYSVDLAGFLLFLIAIWSLVSLGFSLARIGSFTPAPGFAFHWYRFNPQGLSADEAMIRTTLGAALAFTWFGLYEFGRSANVSRRVLNVLVFLLLLANGIVLLVQASVDPGFLHPVGFPEHGRLNGSTSFCYALGDATMALFLLLPAWGVSRGWAGALTMGSLALLALAIVRSGSRTALFTALLAVVLWTGLRVGRLFMARRRLAASSLLAGLMLLPGLVVVAYVMTPADQATPLGRLKDQIEHGGGASSLLGGRLSSYPLIFRVLGEYPLTGVGVGLYPAEVGKQHALLTPDLKVLQPYLLSSYAPSQLLNTGVELGLPAMVGLLVVLVFATVRAIPRKGCPGRLDLAISLLAMGAALQVGPAFHNSEALFFFWLVIGLAASAGSPAGTASEPCTPGRTVGPRATTAVVVLAALVVLGGQCLALPSLAIDHQWKRLRWPMNIGMEAREEGGRWTAPEATFTVRTSARELILRWHTGDPVQPGYRAVVSFFVDGELVEKSVASSGRIRESVLPLPQVQGLKRVSVRVSPPFIPANANGGEDRRRLGIFLHSRGTGPEGSPERSSQP
jgi:hypothetical protein